MLNPQKTSILVNLFGEGAALITRRLQWKSTRVQGSISPTARLLGPHLHEKGCVGEEIKLRIKSNENFLEEAGVNLV